MKVSFNFLSHIIVSPEDAKAVLAVEDVGRAPNGDLMLRITNSGAGIAVLTASDVRLTDAAGKRSELKPEDFKIGDFSAFMPRQTRRATIAAKDLTGLTGRSSPFSPSSDLWHASVRAGEWRASRWRAPARRASRWCPRGGMT